MSETLVSAFCATAASAPEAPAITFGPATWTHGALDRQGARLAGGLAQRGVGAQDRVGVLLPNGPALVVAHLAVGRRAAVRLCLDPRAPAPALGRLIEDAAPAVVLTDADGAARLAACDAETVVITCEPGSEPWRAVATAPQDALPEPGDVALLAYTSGTTGQPKGVGLTHAGLLHNARALLAEWRWTASDRLLLALPMYHMHGLGVCLHGALLSGSSVDLRERFDATEVATATATGDCSLFMGVPTMYARLLETEGGRLDLGRVRLCVSGSAPLSVALSDAFESATGHRILERYGMTETAMITSNRHDDRRPGAVGWPLPGVSLRVAPDGEVRVKGPAVLSAYRNQSEATARAFDEEGWFRTGDLGRLSSDGCLTLVGRRSDLIITGGYNVYPREVEDALAAHPAVAECAVVGRPSAEWGQVVVACVRLAEVTEPDALREHLRGLVEPYKVPRVFEVWDALPRNPTGKLRRSALVAGPRS